MDTREGGEAIPPVSGGGTATEATGGGGAAAAAVVQQSQQQQQQQQTAPQSTPTDLLSVPNPPARTTTPPPTAAAGGGMPPPPSIQDPPRILEPQQSLQSFSSSNNMQQQQQSSPMAPSQVDQTRQQEQVGVLSATTTASSSLEYSSAQAYQAFPPDPAEESHSQQQEHENTIHTTIQEGIESVSDIDDEIDDEEKERLQVEKKRASRRYWVQACYISIGAIFGAWARMLLAQIFGENCGNPGTVGWLSSGAPLCVTADGDTLQEGGVLFSDLPANMLGSFLMGLFQNSTVLGLAVPMALAWLPPNHPFQRMPIFHKAFTTGFCGSLTTFSSYNSAMIVLIFGTGSNLPTQIWLALFGYIIGMETAIGSFVGGKSCARWLHRKVNPVLAAEANAVRIVHEEGVYVHWQLPDFERRFLSKLDMGRKTVHCYHSVTYYYYLDMGEQSAEFVVPASRVDALERWRKSTENERRVRHPLLPVLLEIEKAVLVDMVPIPESAQPIAKERGWDTESLKQWLLDRSHPYHGHFPRQSSFASNTFDPADSRWFKLPTAALLAWTIMFALFASLLMLYADDDVVVTYRTMAFALILAPFGALLRWKLSERNGILTDYPWFPFGTFLANVLGSVVSITTVATEYYLEKKMVFDNFWVIGSIRAVRIGFAGCVTTVSTFVAEIYSFMHNHTDCAYPYMWTTLGTACLLCTIIYGIIINLP